MFRFVAVAFGGLALLGGCSKEPPPITKQTYTIPAAIIKQQEAEAEADKKMEAARKQFEDMKKGVQGEPQRMLAALTPQPDSDFFWTFKLQGKPDDLEKIKPEFVKLLESLHWKDQAKEDDLPQWQLPRDAFAQPQKDGFGRVATINLPEEYSNLQIAVARFTNTDDWQKAALTNINRWRGQLQLEPVSIETLDSSVKKIPYAGDEAYLIDETGLAAGRPGMFPSAATKQPESQQPATPSREPKSPAAPAKSDAAKLIEYTAPEAWKPKEGSSLRIATFTVTQADQTAEVAITQFPKVAQMTDPLANVNRWRGELALPAAKEAELPEQTSELKIGDQPATIFFATGTQRGEPTSTLAAMIVRENRVWFVKMQGAATLVSQQRPKFEEFVKSLKFND